MDYKIKFRLFLNFIFFNLILLSNFYRIQSLKASTENNDLINKSSVVDNKINKDLSDYIKKIPDDYFYILGPGDKLSIKVNDQKNELDGIFIINNQGTTYLKRLNEIYVEGLTVKELTKILNEEYKKFVINPSIKINIIGYRQVKFYIEGEVVTPGIHILKGSSSSDEDNDDINIPFSINLDYSQVDDSSNNNSSIIKENNFTYFPTLIDALRKSGGVTTYSNLEDIVVIRRNSISNGGGKISTKINLLKLIEEKDFDQNIRIKDGDIILIKRNEDPALAQISKAIKTNINPKFINIIVAGRVENAGKLSINKSSTLVDAIEFSGGIKVIKGPVRFLRYHNDGSIDKRVFRYKPKAKRGSYKNPYLTNGDVIYVGKSILNITSEVISEVTKPIQGIVSSYGLYKAITD